MFSMYYYNNVLRCITSYVTTYSSLKFTYISNFGEIINDNTSIKIRSHISKKTTARISPSKSRVRSSNNVQT